MFLPFSFLRKKNHANLQGLRDLAELCSARKCKVPKRKEIFAIPRMAWLFFDNLFVKGCGTGSRTKPTEWLK